MNPLAKIRILVVDDSLELLETYASLMRSLGFTVETAANGKIAWEMLQTSEYDVVFSDIRMPEMNGVELLQNIRRRDRTSPCVLMTSGFSDFPADVLFHLGANGFMAKPTGAQSLKEAMMRAFLKTEDLWKQPAKMISMGKLAKRYPSFEDMTSSGEVRFGNGGFCMKQSSIGVKVHEAVNFSFTFQNHVPFQSIEGTGIVQWVHLVDSPERQKGVGVEIKHLTDECRDRLCDWIRSQQFETFIPMK